MFVLKACVCTKFVLVNIYFSVAFKKNFSLALEGENTKRIQSSLMYDLVKSCVVSVSKEVNLIKVTM